MLCVVLVAVLHFAGYMRYLAVWVCGFVKYFDKTRLVCVLAIGKNCNSKTCIHSENAYTKVLLMMWWSVRC